MAAQCDMFTASQTRNAKAAKLGRLERGKAEAWAAREANQLTAREKDEAERIEQARKEAAAEAEERHQCELAEAIHREDNARIRHRIKWRSRLRCPPRLSQYPQKPLARPWWSAASTTRL
ncbi:hypothetical protein [Thioclava sp.]|uniref:hypothetical protein n=1 Tax=Thioclava sp. TaxID=1933450 RepID=UPI003242B719